MGAEIRVLNLVKIKDSDLRAGQIGKIIDGNCSEYWPIIEVQFSDGCHGYFEKDETEKFEGLVCPSYALEELWVELSKSYETESGLMQKCLNGHEFYIWGYWSI